MTFSFVPFVRRTPTCRQLLAFLQGQRMALAGGSVDEREADLVLQQSRRLLFDDGVDHRAVGLERSVRRGHEAVEFQVLHGSLFDPGPRITAAMAQGSKPPRVRAEGLGAWEFSMVGRVRGVHLQTSRERTPRRISPLTMT